MSANRKKLLWPAVIAAAATFTTLLLVSASTGAFGLSANFPPIISLPTSDALAEKSASASPASINSADERLEGELVVVEARGFEPAEITRPAGPFLLIVDNRSGLEQVQVRVERVTGRERLYDIPLSRKDYSWNSLLRLPPGEYVLTVAGHPEWVCRLTLTAD
jgi:hypothetical protein